MSIWSLKLCEDFCINQTVLRIANRKTKWIFICLHIFFRVIILICNVWWVQKVHDKCQKGEVGWRWIIQSFLYSLDFHWLGPLGRVSHRVAMSVCMYVSPSLLNFFKGPFIGPKVTWPDPRLVVGSASTPWKPPPTKQKRLWSYYPHGLRESVSINISLRSCIWTLMYSKGIMCDI